MRRKQSFFGGIFPKEQKQSTALDPIEVLKTPETLVVPLLQHSGVEATCVVTKGDEILKGQVLASAAEGISAPIHAPVSGKVMSIEQRTDACGVSVTAIVIENDGAENWVERNVHPDPVHLDPDTIRNRIQEAGVVGLGGGGFPTALKLSPPSDVIIDYLIINGCECEPYLTADHRLMVEYPADIVLGAKLMAKALQARQIIIAVEDNKPDAYQALLQEAGAIEVVSLPTRYPQGGERQLIQALTRREVPSGELPYMAGTIVQNVGTAWAVAKALRDGEPLISRIVTVTGEPLQESKNFLVPIGTSIEYLLEAVGGFQGVVGKIVVGGPMMGGAQFDLSAPITKIISGVIVFDEAVSKTPPVLPCIKCARCVDVCPANLLPLRLEAFGRNEKWDDALEDGALDCIECGSCTYICPSKRPLLEYIRLAKSEINARQKKSS